MPVQRRECLIFNRQDIVETRWDFADGVPEDTRNRRLALKPGLASAAKGAQASDLRGREIAIDQLNLRGAAQLADLLVGNPADSTQLGEAPREAPAVGDFAPD